MAHDNECGRDEPAGSRVLQYHLSKGMHRLGEGQSAQIRQRHELRTEEQHLGDQKVRGIWRQ